MDNNCLNTPEGTRDRLFSECRGRRSAQSAITGLFKRRGYSEVITPEVEYYDLFLNSGNPLPQESMVKLVDKSGKILVMRPDCTAPIARVAATKLAASNEPQRLYYNQTIFRSGDAHRGNESELTQCGIELIGAPGIKGDVEVIAMAIDVLNACGLSDFQIELGHSGFFKGLTEGMELKTDIKDKMHSLIEMKNFAGLSDLMDSLGDTPQIRSLRRLPLMFGDSSVLQEARGMTNQPEAIEAIDYLQNIYQILDKAGRGSVIRFDLGLINRLDYYTGAVFRGYARGSGRDVLVGGRYDNLVGCYGADRPATGFAIYVDELVPCLKPAELPVLDTLIHYDDNSLATALEQLDSLPGGTGELSNCKKVDDTIALARKKGAGRVIVCENNTVREVSA